MKSTFNSLGEVLYAMRVRRNMSIDDLHVDCSRSTISRFENSTSSPSIDNVTSMFAGVHANLKEPLTLVNIPNQTNDTWQLLQQAILTENPHLLLREMHRLQLESDSISQLLYSLLAAYHAYLLDNVRSGKIESLTKCLLADGPWFDLEFELFSVGIYLTAESNFSALIDRAIHELAQYPSYDHEDNLMIGLYNAAVRAAEDKKPKTALYLINVLNGIKPPTLSLSLRYRITMVTLALTYNAIPDLQDAALAKIKTIFAALKVLAAEDLISADIQWLQKIGVPVTEID